MAPEKLLAYFRYLRSRIDALLGTPVVGVQEFTPLQSELRLFRKRVAELAYLKPEIREHLISVDICVDPVHLAGTREYWRETWWMRLPWLRLYFLPSRQAKDKEIIDAELSKLRDHIYDLYRLTEVTFKNT